MTSRRQLHTLYQRSGFGVALDCRIADALHRLRLFPFRHAARNGRLTMVTMRYFAWVREKIGKESEELELPTSGSTADALIDWLTLLGEGYAFLTEQKLVVRVAVDQQLISLHDEIGDASEIAIFPPMTGG